MTKSNSLAVNFEPSYEIYELAPITSDYAIVIPVINEGERIQNQLRKLKSFDFKIDVLVADGGSTDGSLDPNFLRDVGVNTLLVKTGPGKLSAQMRMGLHFGTQIRNYKGFIFVDGNGKDDVSAIARFKKALDEGYDHIQGSRYMPGGSHSNTPLLRTVAVKVLHAPLIAWASGFKYSDTTNGFRAYSTRMLLADEIQALRKVFKQYELHYFLAVRAPRTGFKCCEIPVTRNYPKAGKVPTKIKGLKGYVTVLEALFKSCFGVYNVRNK